MYQASIQAQALPLAPSAGETPARVRLWPHYLLVLLFYALVYGFIFRGLIIAIPELWRGESVLSFDEMVPIFDDQTQFWSQIKGEFSELTNGYEFRVRYSFLTTWMRYYSIVPLTIILTAILSTYAAFAFLTLFLRKLAPHLNQRRLLYASAASVLLMNLILVYSKITHFYTLILGFDLFLGSFLLLLAATFFGSRHPLWLLICANLLTTVNPGVHYIVIYCIVHVIVTLFTAIRPPSQKNENQSPMRRWKRFFIANGLLMLFTVLPYALLVKYFFLYGFENLHDTVPVNYFLIRNTSIPLIKQLSLDITSIMDNFLYGQYSPPYPRITNIFYFVVGCLPFIPSVQRKLLPESRHKDLLACLGTVLLLSLWFSIGYSSMPYLPTFHRTLALVVNSLYALENGLANFVVSACATAIEILRFPHRFQFITFAILMILMPLGIVQTQDAIMERLNKIRPPHAAIYALLLICFFAPLLSNWSYRTTFLSGNFNHFLTPYPIKNLREVKDVLDSLPKGKTIVLPPSEAQKRTTDENGIRHKFIDKFFIYYLNKPSYHFGQSGTLETKNDFFFMLWAMLNNENWWTSIVREQNVKYLVISKEIGPNRFTSNEYLSNIEAILQKNIADIPVLLQKKFENPGFILYELSFVTDPLQKKDYLNLSWEAYRCYEQRSSYNGALFDVTLNNSKGIPSASGAITIITDNVGKAQMDLYAKARPELFFRPDIASLAFNGDLIPSSLYFNIMYSMFNVFSIGKYNYLNMLIPGTYDALTSSFLGLPKKAFIKIPITVNKDGTYEIYLRSMPTRNELSVSIGNASTGSVLINNPSTQYIRQRTIRSRNPDLIDVSAYPLEELAKLIPKSIVPVNNAYRYNRLLTVELKAGKHWLSLEKKDGNPLVLEGVLLKNLALPSSGVPAHFIDIKTQ